MKSNRMVEKSQVSEREISVGVDMGGSLWATSINYRDGKKPSYYAFRDDEKNSKEEKLYGKIRELLMNGYHVCVYYEAGRYGFAPARILEYMGAEVVVVPVNRLEFYCGFKVIKTDRIDSRKLSQLFETCCGHVPRVYVPTLEEESRRCGERERKRLKTNIGRLNNQMISKIEQTPVKTPSGHMPADGWKKWLVERQKRNELKDFPRLSLRSFENLIAELELNEIHLKKWDEMLCEEVKKDRRAAAEAGTQYQYDLLIQFKGIGPEIARHFCWEVGDFNRFRNSKAFGEYLGLTSCHFASGNMQQDHGISKAGRGSLRRMAVEMAWLFVRWQPQCRLVQKWAADLAQKGRIRRRAIVALARQLMVALWHVVVRGGTIDGALVKKTVAVQG